MGQRTAEGDCPFEALEDDTALENGPDRCDGGRGSLDMLAKVWRRMRLPSRQALRMRMAGGLLRLGIFST